MAQESECYIVEKLQIYEFDDSEQDDYDDDMESID